MAIEPLKENYGIGVDISYYDIGESDEARNRAVEIGRGIGRPMSFPAVLVNGLLKSEGLVSFYELSEIIDALNASV